MTKKKVLLGSLLGLALTAVTVTTAHAYQRGDWDKRLNFLPKMSEARQEKRGVMKNIDPEKLEAMQAQREARQEKRAEMREIFANKDYNAWESLMQEKVELMRQRADELSATINQDTFEKMSMVHERMLEGKYEEAKELREELGLETGFGGPRGGMWLGHRMR